MIRRLWREGKTWTTCQPELPRDRSQVLDSFPRYPFGASSSKRWLCPARIAWAGGGKVWVEFMFIAQCWLEARSPVPSLRLEHGVVLPSKGTWA
jgi:hypothetical protein